MVTERIHDRQADGVGDDTRPERQSVAEPGDRGQDPRHDDHEPGRGSRGALDREVSDVRDHEGKPDPPLDDRRGEPEHLTVTGKARGPAGGRRGGSTVKHSQLIRTPGARTAETRATMIFATPT